VLAQELAAPVAVGAPRRSVHGDLGMVHIDSFMRGCSR
jgi:hypothetical protein